MATETLNIRALNMLMARIAEEHDRRAIGVVSGAAKSVEDYRSECGFLRGLEMVRQMCRDVEDEIYGKNTEAK